MKATLPASCALAILLAIGSTSLADTKSHRMAAESMLKEMGIEKQMQSAIDQSVDMQVKTNAQLAPFKDPMKKFMTKHMSWDSLKDDLITIYTEAFTEKEMNDIKAFYQTPTGKKMAEKAPEMMSKGMMLGVKRVQDNQAELQKMIQDHMAKPQ